MGLWRSLVIDVFGILLARNAWEKRKLGDLGSVAMNKRIYKDQTSDEGEIPFYKIGSFGKQADAFISRKLFNEYKKLYPFPKKGDILISASGSIGRTIVYNGEDAYFQDSNIIWIQHDNRLDNTFLHQLFNIIRWSGVEGTTIKRLYNKNILSTQILLPSVEEQRSIGNLLDNVDNLIAATQDKIDALEQTKRALLQRLFDQSWRFKGYSGSWEKHKLGDLAKRVRGNDGRMDLPILTISAGNGWLTQKERFSQSIAGNELKNYTLLAKNELSYNHGNSKLAKYGAVFALEKYNEALVPRVYHSFDVSGKADSNFIEYLFSSKTPDHELRKLISSGARMDGLLNINYESFMNISLLFPSIEEQQKISGILEITRKLSSETQLILSRLTQIKKALLQKLFI